MNNDIYLYPYSAAKARERNELSFWRESHKMNIACRDAIENAIRQSFDGMNLRADCLKTSVVLMSSGLKRSIFLRTSTTIAILLSEAIRLCWMALSILTAKRCRR